MHSFLWPLVRISKQWSFFRICIVFFMFFCLYLILTLIKRAKSQPLRWVLRIMNFELGISLILFNLLELNYRQGLWHKYVVFNDLIKSLLPICIDISLFPWFKKKKIELDDNGIKSLILTSVTHTYMYTYVKIGWHCVVARVIWSNARNYSLHLKPFESAKTRWKEALPIVVNLTENPKLIL